MENNLILFYSKYSENSKNVFTYLSTLMSDNVKLVCVDNKNIRDKIKNSNGIKINYIPTLLIYKEDKIEKYDNDNIYNVLDLYLEKNKSQQQPQQPQQQQPQPQQQQPQQQQHQHQRQHQQHQH